MGDIAGIRGSAADNTLVGTVSWDSALSDIRGVSIEGMAGNDSIMGSILGDRIIGGTGDDRLTGGAGNDVFVFGSNDGLDFITDFADGIDHISAASGVSNISFSSYYDGSGALQASVWFDNTQVVFVGLNPGQITAADLI